MLFRRLPLNLLFVSTAVIALFGRRNYCAVV
jgi:hypothetical protein